MADNGIEREHTSIGEFLSVVSVCFVLGLVAYWPLLNLYFIYDDLPMLMRSSPQLGNGLVQLFAPMGNGFWRPLHSLMAWGIEGAFGREPLAFHLVSLGCHALNGGLLYLLMRRMAVRRLSTALATALFIVHVAGYSAVAQPANSSDLTLATAMLLACLGWEMRRNTTAQLGTGMLLAGILIGLVSKETFALLPLALFCWGLAVGVTPRAILRDRAFVLASAVCILYGLIAVGVQFTGRGTYASDGRLSLSPISFIRRFCDYSISMVVPYIHVLELPFRHIPFPGWLLWIIRLGVLGGLGGLLLTCILRPGSRRAAALLLIGLGILLPVSFLSLGIESRFLYAALPFAIASLALALDRNRFFPLIVTILGLGYFAGFYFSRTPAALVEVGRETRLLVDAIQMEHLKWETGDGVIILQHPHIAPEPHNWVYRQLIFEVWLGRDRFRYLPDAERERADFVYTFEDGKLVPTP